MDEATREAIYDALEEVLPDRETAMKRNRRLKSDLDFATRHSEEWRLLYPDRWIAVYDLKLIAVEPDIKLLRGAIARTNAPASDTYVEYLRREEPLMML